MSKYGWISDSAEHYLNLALRERVMRWTGKPLAEERMLQHLRFFGQTTLRTGLPQGPGKGDKVFERGLLELAGPLCFRDTAEFARRQQGHKYRGTHYLRCAINEFKRQKVQDLPGMCPRSLKGHLAMKKKAGDIKRFMKEVQKRYEVIDRMYGATIRRKNGRLDRVGGT